MYKYYRGNATLYAKQALFWAVRNDKGLRLVRSPQHAERFLFRLPNSHEFSPASAERACSLSARLRHGAATLKGLKTWTRSMLSVS